MIKLSHSKSFQCRAGAIVLGIVALFSVAGHAHAELIATPLRGDTRLVEFQFDQDNTFLVLSKPRAVTHVQFAPDETIQSVAAGDTANWDITPTKNRKNLFLKPKYEDLDTSLTVLTDKRTYQFVLRSTGDGKKWYQRVSWVYSREVVLDMEPMVGDEAATSQAGSTALAPTTGSGSGAAASGYPGGIDPGKMRFGYKVEGDAKFRPEVVFDDGRFTYFRMPSDLQEQPALFAVIEGDDFSLVNYTVNGNYIIAQRVLENAVLKLGKPEVRIRREPPKRGFFGQTTGE